MMMYVATLGRIYVVHKERTLDYNKLCEQIYSVTYIGQP